VDEGLAFGYEVAQRMTGTRFVMCVEVKGNQDSAADVGEFSLVCENDAESVQRALGTYLEVLRLCPSQWRGNWRGRSANRFAFADCRIIDGNQCGSKRRRSV
jgi:hypothetical protein